MDESLLELLLDVLSRTKSGVDIESLIEAIDYLEHIRLTHEETEEALIYLLKEGMVVEEHGKWLRA